MTSRYNIVIAAAVLALAQIGFLGWMIAGRAALLRNGQEVLLKVEPVDPRDLLRGDYVRLGYEISRIPVEMIGKSGTGRSDDSRRADRRAAEKGCRWLLARDGGMAWHWRNDASTSG